MTAPALAPPTMMTVGSDTIGPGPCPAPAVRATLADGVNDAVGLLDLDGEVVAEAAAGITLADPLGERLALEVLLSVPGAAARVSELVQEAAVDWLTDECQTVCSVICDGWRKEGQDMYPMLALYV